MPYFYSPTHRFDWLIYRISHHLNCIFFFQIQNEKCLQDIGDLLSTGEISSLFSPDEKLEIIEKMSQIDKQRDKTLQTNGTPTALYNFYLTVNDFFHGFLCVEILQIAFSGNSRAAACHSMHDTSWRLIPDQCSQVPIHNKLLHH